MGVHSNVLAMLAFNRSNTLGATNRVMSSGLLIACGAIGDIIGSLMFRGQNPPGYGPDIYTTIGLCLWNLFALVTLILVFRKRNQRMEKGELVEKAPEGYRYSL